MAVPAGRHIIDVLEEPVGQVYERLLRAGLKVGAKLLFTTEHIDAAVVKHQLSVLNPYLITKEYRTEWPGTWSAHAVLVFEFGFTSDVVELLIAEDFPLYPKSVFSWAENGLDNLSIVRVDDTPWLVTIYNEYISTLRLIRSNTTN